jgi:hypothetical protein
VSAFRKVAKNSNSSIGQLSSRQESKAFVFYQEATQYWVKAVVGLPYYAKDGVVGAPAHGRYVHFAKAAHAAAACAIMNSSLFYAYFIAYGDCFHLSDTLVGAFPILSTMLDDEVLVERGRALNAALVKTASRKSINTRDGSEISYAEFRVAESKAILDDIDRRLAHHYGFTPEEAEFIISYDFKYRMGQEDSADDE